MESSVSYHIIYVIGVDDSQCLLVVMPGQRSLCGIWLKQLTIDLDTPVSEYRVLYDATIQFLPSLFPCRGFAPLSHRVSRLSARVERVEHAYFLCGI